MNFEFLPDPAQLAVFCVTAMIVLVTPGPAVLYVVARSIGDGWRTGVASAIGMSLGAVVHIALLVAGLAAVVAEGPLMRQFVQLAGSVFLIMIGVARFRAGIAQPQQSLSTAMNPGPPAQTGRSAMLDAAIVNVLNPKAIIFLLAFLPQFARADDPSVLRAQLLVYGIVFIALGFTTDTAYALLAARVRDHLVSRASRMRLLQRVSALTIVALGVVGMVASIMG